MIKFCPTCKGELIITENDNVFECKECMHAFEIVLAEEAEDEEAEDEEAEEVEDEEAEEVEDEEESEEEVEDEK